MDLTSSCIDCGAPIEAPFDSIIGEIIGCPDCGLDYVIIEDDAGTFSLRELMIEGEDWGE